MATTSFSVKASTEFVKRYRAFCEEHCLQLGKFTEQALSEVMEDYHFGLKAQRVLSRGSGVSEAHQDYFKKRE